MRNSNKYDVYKKLIVVLIFLCSINMAQAQAKKYIMFFAGEISYPECNCNYARFRLEYNGVHLDPIGGQKVESGSFLIYDKRPTYYEILLYQPDSEMCSGYCHDGWEYHVGGNITADCTPMTDYNGMYMITDQVLVDPGINNSFCETIALKATGCTGPQRFFWEYRIDGGSFVKTNISTAFDETFQFVKSNYIASTYTGNIDFRVVIDSDPTTTGENVYSNIVSYNVIPCSPDLDKKPEASKTTCTYNQDGNVILTFSRELVTNESFKFNFYKTPSNALIPTPSYTVDATKKIYTFTGLAQGDYYIVYQTFLNSQYSSTNKLPNPSFTISPPDAVYFEVIENQPLCKGGNGMLTIKAKGGTSPYYCQINSESEIEFTSSLDINKPEGTYLIKVRDKYTCIDTTAND
ncbi:hypothetical protein [Flavobacterium branchiicola]|uniref:SprB-like repeat protein n=1 Tax=Flavobacterium branchiicola TaxID=1114875 RepID=A0ABV9PDM5_9FLAO|nr:hypothetical protein [Flavobacterium branchiicola]MBS7253181.1 hypothetical protein [Flavobacterium branchiicola]